APLRWLEQPMLADQRLAQAFLTVDPVEAPAAAIAEPAVVNGTIGARVLAQHLVHPHVRAHVAADRTVAADARGSAQLPWPRDKAIALGRERADRHPPHDIAGEDRVEGRVGVHTNLGAEAALLHDQAVLHRHRLTEAHTALAGDAALAVEQDVLADGDGLGVVALL